MKKLHSFAFYALITPAITLGAGSVLAQQSTGQDSDREQGAKQSDPLTATDRRNMDDKKYGMQNRGYLGSAPANGMQASNLIDAEVKTTGDEDIGSVSDLIIDKNGQVVAIVIGVGGFLGMGEKDVAIGWDDVTRSGTFGEQELRIDATRETLSAAPEFDTKKATARTAQSDQNTRRARQPDSQMTADRRNTSDKKYHMQNRGYMGSAPADGMQASNLIGTDVKTTGDEKVGPVSDLIIDEKGQVVAVVVGVGGFLGMGERDVAIGWDDVTRSGTSDDLELRIDATRETLRTAPEFDTKKATARTAQSEQSTRRAKQPDALVAADRRNTSDKKYGDKKHGMQNRGYMGSAPANGIQASNLIGANVKTTDDEEVGPVSDLIIDEKGQVVAVVVGVGGFLGMGERNVAIGWDDVTRSGTSDDLELRIDATRETLRTAPDFEAQD